MLPAGRVTDVVKNRSKALHTLGNGVVPLQAVYALRWLLHVAGPTSQHCTVAEAELDPGPATPERTLIP